MPDRTQYKSPARHKKTIINFNIQYELEKRETSYYSDKMTYTAPLKSYTEDK